MLFTRAAVFVELVQTASGKSSDVFRQKVRSRILNDASTGTTLGSEFIP